MPTLERSLTLIVCTTAMIALIGAGGSYAQPTKQNPKSGPFKGNTTPGDPKTVKEKKAAKVKAVPTYPATITTPSIYRCPLNVRVQVRPSGEPESLSLRQTRLNQAQTGSFIICEYGFQGSLSFQTGPGGACPAERPSGHVVGPNPNTTTNTDLGCNNNTAFCHGPATGFKLTNPEHPEAKFGQCTYTAGSLTLSFSPPGESCTGTPGSPEGFSKGGRALCW